MDTTYNNQPISKLSTDVRDTCYNNVKQILIKRELSIETRLRQVEQRCVVIGENIKTMSKKTVRMKNLHNAKTIKREKIDIFTVNPSVHNSYIIEVCSNIDLPGLKYVSETKEPKLHRLLWIILHLGAILISAYYIQNAYYQWQGSPVIQSYQSMSTKVDEIPFPAVTMCFSIPMKEDYNRWEIINKCVYLQNNGSWVCSDEELIEFIISVEISPLQFSEFNNVSMSDWSLFKEPVSKLYRHLNRTITGGEYHRCVDRLTMECKQWTTNRIVHLLSGDLCNGSLSPKLLTTIKFDTNVCKLLMCHTYNGVKHGPQYQGVIKQHEYNFDLEMGLPIPPQSCDWTPEHMLDSGCRRGSNPVYNRKDVRIIFDPNKINGESDFFVSVHNPSEYPTLEFLKTFRISRRTSVIIDITPELVTSEEELSEVEISKRGCIFSHERSLSMFKFYTNQNCFLECHINCGLNMCGCVPSSLAVLKNAFPVCNGWKSQFCNLESCKCDCPSDCVSLTYDANIEINKDLAFNSVIAKLEYKNNEFLTRFRYSVTSPAEFVAYSLGILGVFNGFSVMIVWEILYWLTIKLWSTVKGQVGGIHPKTINDH